MTGGTMRLGPDEMWTLLEHIDLVDVLHDGLRRTGARPGELSKLEPGLLSFHDRDTGRNGELPADDLRTLRMAGLAALAARLLVAGGVVTASVVGPRQPTQWQLGVIGRYVPDVSHVSVFTGDRAGRTAVAPRVHDQLDLAGIGISVARSVAEAVFGATLVVALGPAAGQIDYEQLAHGSLLVNGADRMVSNGLRDGVTRRYGLDDLARMLAGDRPGRVRPDEILLVELLDSGWSHDLDVLLAHRLVRSALHFGVGILDKDGATS